MTDKKITTAKIKFNPTYSGAMSDQLNSGIAGITTDQ